MKEEKRKKIINERIGKIIGNLENLDETSKDMLNNIINTFEFLREELNKIH
jgi:hypothetical protein